MVALSDLSLDAAGWSGNSRSAPQTVHRMTTVERPASLMIIGREVAQARHFVG
jgi:hypothetical protein